MSLSTDVFLHQRLGRYEIRERLGVGGMARVFMGWDTSLERQVAIKILHDHLVDDSTFKERFEREAKLVAALNHPNVVQIYDYDTITINNEIVCYMVMPYFSGKTLHDLLSTYKSTSQHLSQESVLGIMLQMCAALGYAHGRGMIHRDVKPTNIMFDEHERAILTDFGIARLKEAINLTQDGATVGTPAYISPEQAAGLPVDSRTDLYSLGIILYEMIAGELPYKGDSMFSLILQHINDPIPNLPLSVPNTSVYLQSFMYKALAKDPNDRFQTAAEFANALKLAFEQSSAQSSPNETQNITPVFTNPPRSQDTHILTQQELSTNTKSRTPVLLFAIAGILVLAISAIVISRTSSTNLNNPMPINSTAISSMTEDEGTTFQSTFESGDPTISQWQQTSDGDVQRRITATGVYQITNQLPGTATTAMYNPSAHYLNGTITIQAALDSASSRTSGYGIIFRYRDESNYNVFAVDGAGRFSLWQLKNAEWIELRELSEKWTDSPSVKAQGKTNQISVTFTNDQIIGYVNEHNLVKVKVDEAAVMPGAIGIYVASTTTGPALVSVDSFEIGSYVASMTADSP